MRRLRSKAGAVVRVDDATAARLLADGWTPADARPRPGGYAAMKVADLKAEIGRRNEGRDDADRLPDDGRKADLVAVLEADDE